MRDIGLDVSAPQKECNDPKCPFHGTLPVRGQVFSCTVVSDKMDNTVVVLRKFEKKQRSMNDSRRGSPKSMRTIPLALKPRQGIVSR